MRAKNCTIFWTVYFDSRLTRGEGRRLPKKFCVPSPSLDELKRACKALNLDIIEIKRARYPRVWWIEGGYVMVKRTKKEETLRKLARVIRENRSRGG
ncbi:signal recognition particle protein Srp19 [Candidatus Geothermarchaeota archaeon]|nr:MAG: signal recognition particle protein Srp19 [Candidatus Geothermarchaeota archaeon]